MARVTMGTVRARHQQEATAFHEAAAARSGGRCPCRCHNGGCPCVGCTSACGGGSTAGALGERPGEEAGARATEELHS
jgi:hypothetical protein